MATEQTRATGPWLSRQPRRESGPGAPRAQRGLYSGRRRCARTCVNGSWRQRDLPYRCW